MGKVEKELDELLKLDIIEKVEGEPTPWVSPIVTPPKKDGKEIRLCVDMREANQAVKREKTHNAYHRGAYSGYEWS